MLFDQPSGNLCRCFPSPPPQKYIVFYESFTKGTHTHVHTCLYQTHVGRGTVAYPHQSSVVCARQRGRSVLIQRVRSSVRRESRPAPPPIGPLMSPDPVALVVLRWSVAPLVVFTRCWIVVFSVPFLCLLFSSSSSPLNLSLLQFFVI